MTGITINPQQLTNAPNTFTVSTYGGMQGMFVDDPAIRNELISAIVAPSQETPLWGGMGITESLPTAGVEADSVGSVVALATSETNLTGFTVFNQAHAMINSPASPVPLAAAGNGTNPGGGVSLFRLGSGARLWVACSSATASAFAGGAINAAAYWDYTNQVLLSSPGGTALPGVKVLKVDAKGNSQTVTYASGLATWTYNGYAALIQI